MNGLISIIGKSIPRTFTMVILLYGHYRGSRYKVV